MNIEQWFSASGDGPPSMSTFGNILGCHKLGGRVEGASGPWPGAGLDVLQSAGDGAGRKTRPKGKAVLDKLLLCRLSTYSHGHCRA